MPREEGESGLRRDLEEISLTWSHVERILFISMRFDALIEEGDYSQFLVVDNESV